MIDELMKEIEMPYTSQGYMTHEDIRDWEESTDNGSIYIDLQNPPTWFNVEIACPLCGTQILEHESVRVIRASDEVWFCIDSSGVTHQEEGEWY